jgi:hypothetical protein
LNEVRLSPHNGIIFPPKFFVAAASRAIVAAPVFKTTSPTARKPTGDADGRMAASPLGRPC